MRFGWTCIVAVVMCLGAELTTEAQGGEEVQLTGTLTCGMCDLERTKMCTTVLLVANEENEEVLYTLAKNDVTKAAHKRICKEAVDDVTVKGSVSTAEGQHTLTPSKITFPEK